MKSIFTLKSKFVKHLKNTNPNSESIAKTLSKVIRECTKYKTAIHHNKYDKLFYTFVFDETKCYCIEVEPIKSDRKLKESMIDIVEVPYSEFIKNGKIID
jgi:hypothetical protein